LEGIYSVEVVMIRWGNMINKYIRQIVGGLTISGALLYSGCQKTQPAEEEHSCLNISYEISRDTEGEIRGIKDSEGRDFINPSIPWGGEIDSIYVFTLSDSAKARTERMLSLQRDLEEAEDSLEAQLLRDIHNQIKNGR